MLPCYLIFLFCHAREGGNLGFFSQKEPNLLFCFFSPSNLRHARGRF